MAAKKPDNFFSGFGGDQNRVRRRVTVELKLIRWQKNMTPNKCGRL